MKQHLAYITHDYQLNEADRVRFCEELASGEHSFTVEHWSVPPLSPRADWDKMVHNHIGRSDFMIVLVSKGMEMGPVELQIAEAQRCNVPFFGVYTDGAKASVPLPEGLGANRTIPWDWERIESGVKQVLGEGKHHVFR